MVHTPLCNIWDQGLKECRYSTGSNLNTYSALIQNFYSQETAPHPAILVSVNAGVEEGKEAGVTAYTRCVSTFPR
jgi:translation initiation factor 3 subunit F